MMSDLSESLIELNSAPDSDRAVICLPQAGAGSSSFLPLAKSLRSDASVWAACFPGRERRIFERPLATIGEMAASLLGPVRDVAAGNVVILGQCSGALVAYELAHMLTVEGRIWTRSWLVACSQSAPGEPIGIRRAPRAIPDVAAELRAIGGTPEKLLQSQEFIKLMTPAIEADLNAVERYRVPAGRRPVRMSIAIFTGSDDDLLNATDLLAWQSYTAGSFRIERFPGDHFFMTGQEAVVRAKLLALLEREEASGTMAPVES
jgi:medium-chain acyl-[acyl-carrier-protein] hydrolase